MHKRNPWRDVHQMLHNIYECSIVIRPWSVVCRRLRILCPHAHKLKIGNCKIMRKSSINVFPVLVVGLVYHLHHIGVC
jgi:hypothetical protein